MKKTRPIQPRTPVLLITGLPGSGKSRFVRRLEGSLGAAAEVVAVRDAAELDRRLRRQRRECSLLVEARGPVEPLDLIDIFGDAPHARRWSLAEIVAVVDAPRFFPLFEDDDDTGREGQTALEQAVNHIELASVVALEDTQLLRRPFEDGRIPDVIRCLNPSARLAPPRSIATDAFDVDRCHRDAAWLSVPSPASLASGSVGVYKYRARRPFHPERLASALAMGWPGVLRSKGFVWIASRGEERGVYLQAGRVWRLDAAGPWWASVPQEEWPDREDDLTDIRQAWDVRTGDRRQELVFVGVGLRPDEIRRDLDACLLDVRETAAGAAAWGALPDPLPSWDEAEPDEKVATAAWTALGAGGWGVH